MVSPSPRQNHEIPLKVTYSIEFKVWASGSAIALLQVYSSSLGTTALQTRVILKGMVAQPTLRHTQRTGPRQLKETKSRFGGYLLVGSTLGGSTESGHT